MRGEKRRVPVIGVRTQFILCCLVIGLSFVREGLAYLIEDTLVSCCSCVVCISSITRFEVFLFCLVC